MTKRAQSSVILAVAIVGCTATSSEPVRAPLHANEAVLAPAPPPDRETDVPGPGPVAVPRDPEEVKRDIRQCLEDLKALMLEVPPEVALMPVPPRQNSNSGPLLRATSDLLVASTVGSISYEIWMQRGEAGPPQDRSPRIFAVQVARSLKPVRDEWQKVRDRMPGECAWLTEYDQVMMRCLALTAEAQARGQQCAARR